VSSPGPVPDPPLSASNFGYSGALHNATGRYWYMNLSKRF
jgi:hypothetical protein